MDRFPLPDDSKYSYGSNFGAHQGTDILAPLGTPVLAVEAGKAWSNIEPKGGRVVYLLASSGVRYFYAHLGEWALKLISATKEKPLTVASGDELGKVGTSGNAYGRAPHLHFQIRRGSSTSNPFHELLNVDLHKRGVAENAGGVLALALMFLLTKGWR